MEELLYFLQKVPDDPRIGTTHISIYVALWSLWIKAGMKEPLSFNRQQLIAACKISGFTTYHKTIRQLAEYGYVGYAPTFDHTIGSRAYFTRKGIEECKVKQQLM